jgi:poly(rC)-binding protein 2/3/4
VPSQQQDGGAGGTKRPLEDGDQQAGPEPKRQEQGAAEAPGRELVYRLLVPASKAGLAIGPKGAVAAQIEQDTASKITVIDGVPGCDERIVIISSRDDPAQAIPGAQRALFDVHKRCLQSDNPEAAITTRMLIGVSQAGYIIGKSGRTIGETKDASGAFCKVMRENETPICGLENDRLLQINGNQLQTAKALQILAEQIRFQPPRDFPGGPVPHLPVFQQQQQQQQQQHGGPMMGGRMGMMPPMGMGMGPGRPPMGPPMGGMYGRPYGGYGY